MEKTLSQARVDLYRDVEGLSESGPIIITKGHKPHAKPIAVLVGYADYQRLKGLEFDSGGDAHELEGWAWVHGDMESHYFPQGGEVSLCALYSRSQDWLEEAPPVSCCEVCKERRARPLGEGKADE